MRDYVSSKITADDYEYYKENIDTFSQLWDKYVDNKVLSLLDEYLAEADKFYKINTDRNIYFTDNMFTKESVLEKRLPFVLLFLKILYLFLPLIFFLQLSIPKDLFFD